MKLKNLVELTIIIALCLSNYMIIMQYYNEYVPENFSIKQLLDKQYRCIRYFHAKQYDKFAYNSCKKYTHDYVEFQLERSRYIYMYYSHNLIMVSMFVIFHLVL
jgi:hypothetical protein